MLIAVLTCALGIVIENFRWPEDRTALRDRFVASTEPREKLSLLTALVLGHSVVRWLLAFAVAAVVVLAALEAPGVRDEMRRAVASDRVSLLGLDALVGIAISILMIVLAVAARRISR